MSQDKITVIQRCNAFSALVCDPDLHHPLPLRLHESGRKKNHRTGSGEKNRSSSSRQVPYDPDIPKEYGDLLRGAKADDWRIPQIFLALADRHEAEGEEGRALHFLDRAAKAFAVNRDASGEALVFSKKVLFLMQTGREREAHRAAEGGRRKMDGAASPRFSGISRRPPRPAAGRIQSRPGAPQPVSSGQHGFSDGCSLPPTEARCRTRRRDGGGSVRTPSPSAGGLPLSGSTTCPNRVRPVKAAPTFRMPLP